MKLLNRITASRIILFICAVYVSGYFAHAIYLYKTVYGDGGYYYAWLSMHISKYSIGPAIFWYPVYSVTRNEFAVGLVSVMAALFGLILLWNLLLTKFNRTVSIMTVAVVAGASNLFFYGSIDVVNSHALTFFAASVFLSLYFVKKRPWFWLGVALGVMVLIRAQDVVYAVLLLPYIHKQNILKIISGFLLIFWPQLIAWKLASGSLLVSPYLLHEGFNFFRPHILEVLFDVRSGLFLWTPVTILGVIGLVRSKKWLMLLVFLLELYIVASWSTWWQGASYSGRMFVSSLPVLAFGIASVFSSLFRYRFTQSYFILTIVGPLTVINTVSIIYFLLMLH